MLTKPDFCRIFAQLSQFHLILQDEALGLVLHF